ncbi:EAL domain-containing protein [Hahella aquimaris]|uniref:bifunctional diguanylate cyclase/phosphodiesterase n=1 Tax=Hahella sp. HNIBRBA332 TaxID=3015983 RepID=UPI00273B431E|nr:EAL domain-containing protein [Hahella sp. HNIBRBA332]WLQ11740.1 EAL domain-containing protein [Hahella sp. HNIBRBA332]
MKLGATAGRLAALLIILVACVILILLDYRERTRNYYQSMQVELQQTQKNVSASTRRIMEHIAILRRTAESYLLSNHEDHLYSELSANLAYDPTRNLFAMDTLQPPFTTSQVGNLTGLGDIQGRQPNYYREMEMALALTPIFRATKENLPESNWVYYISQNRFLYIAPWIESDKFAYTNESLSLEFFTLALPYHNPERTPFWTRVYVDEFGEGLMVTAAAPIYASDVFNGAVAIDITLDVLKGFVRNPNLSAGELFIVNQSHQLLAHPTLTSSHANTAATFPEALPNGVDNFISHPKDIPTDTFLEIKGYALIRTNIDETPWHLLLSVEQSAIRYAIIEQMTPELALAALIVLFAAFIQRYFLTAGQLERSQRRYRQMFEHCDAVQIILDPQNNKVIDANPAACDFFGFSSEMMGNISASRLFLSENNEMLDEKWLPSLQSGKTVIAARRGDNRSSLVEMYVSEIKDKVCSYLYLIVHDITDRKRSEEQIRLQAYYDPLTRLPNRSYLFEHLNSLIASHKREHARLAVLFIDLDRFKQVNDNLGHGVGDKLLQQVSNRLKSRLRESDMLARLGGDEFTVVLPHLREETDAIHVAKILLQQLAESFSVGDYELHIGASIGVTLFPKDGEDASTLIKNADIAMYKAKDNGRNQYRFFEERMNEAVASRLMLEGDIREATHNEQFHLEFQPIIDLKNMRLAGAEALLRWLHPRFGELHPREFMSIAEETGNIVQISEWLLQNALNLAAEWQYSRPADQQPFIAVNMSRRQLINSQHVKRWRDIIRQSEVPPSSLVLELTEHNLLNEFEESRRSLMELHQMGVRLSLDDYGHGASSLTLLKDLPISMLKLDGLLIRNLGRKTKEEVLMDALVKMGRAMDMKIVAEGVETPQQLAVLRESGCDYGQGYLFSPPAQPRELSMMLEKVFSVQTQDD